MDNSFQLIRFSGKSGGEKSDEGNPRGQAKNGDEHS